MGSWLSLIQQTGGARDQTGDPWVPGECDIHYTTAAPTLTQEDSGCKLETNGLVDSKVD